MIEVLTAGGRVAPALVAEDVRRMIGSRSVAIVLGLCILFGAALVIGVLRTQPQVFPGIRWWPTLGTYQGANQGWTSDPDLVQRQYDTYVGTREGRYLDLNDGDDDERYWFLAGRKYRWRDVLVDESLAPASHTQARDPNWSNYRWNQRDVISEMLDAPAIAEDKAKLSIFIAATATSEKNPVPQWLLDDPRDLTWTDGQGKDHIRLDKEEGWRAMADFYVALVKKYGNDPRIGSIVMGEYYTNPDGGGIPADLDYDAYRANIKHVWAVIDASAPIDARGNRVNVVQSQPITSGGFVTSCDIAASAIGISGSDPVLFQSGPLDPVRRDLYGVVPTTHQANAGNVLDGDPVRWDGTPNPWGFARGQIVPMRYEHVVWYYGSKGRAPLDSMNLRANARLVRQWYEAYDQFGPNGTLTAQWGQIPNYPNWINPLYEPILLPLTAGCIDTDLPAGRRNFGQSDKPLIEIAHVHHAMWVTFTETRCKPKPPSTNGLVPTRAARPRMLPPLYLPYGTRMDETVNGISGTPGPAGPPSSNWEFTTSSRPRASAAVVGKSKDGAEAVSFTRPEVNRLPSKTLDMSSSWLRTTYKVWPLSTNPSPLVSVALPRSTFVTRLVRVSIR
jgi:hypothetical protein